MVATAKLILLFALLGVVFAAVMVWAALRPFVQGVRRSPERMRLVWVVVLVIVGLGVLVGLLKRLVL